MARKDKAARATYDREYYRRNKQRDLARRVAYNREWYRRERLRLISIFGGVCVRCGEPDPVVLDFDHVHDDGSTDSSGAGILPEVKRNPSRFQLLCKNCNWRKEYTRRRYAGGK